MDKRTIKQYYDVVKIAHAIAFFNKMDVKSLGVTKLMKLFFFADKTHLEKVGKSIFNHNYTKMPKGPVPMWIYGIIRTSASGADDYDFSNEVNVFNTLIEANQVENGFDDGFHYVFKNKVEFDPMFFSKSQIKTLEEVCEQYKYTTATVLSDISHETYAWKYANMHDPINKASMVDDQEMKKYVAFAEREERNFSENYQIHKLLQK